MQAGLVVVDEGEVLPAPAIPSPGVRLAQTLGLKDVGRALRDFTAYLPAQFVPALAGFLALPILARQLAPTELGVLTIAQTLISLGWIFASQWVTSAAMREYVPSREEGKLDEYSATLAGGVIVSLGLLMVFGVLLAVAGLVSSAVGSNWLPTFGATAGLVVTNVATTLFAAALRPRWSALIDLVSRTGGVALGTYLVWDGHKVGGYLLGLTLASLPTGVVATLAAWPRLRAVTRPRFSELGAWGRFGLPIAVSSGLFWALLLVDRYLLALLRTTNDVGVYSVGAVVGDKAVSIPLFAFYAAARPVLVSTYETSGRAAVERLMHSYTRLLLVIGVPTVAMAVVTAHPVVNLLVHGFYSQLYAPAAAVVPLIAIGSFIDGIGRIGSVGLGLARRNKATMLAAGIGLGVNVIANLALIPVLGIKGAAIATPISSIAVLTAQRWYARRYVSWFFPYRTAARTIAAGAVGVVAAHYAMSLSHADASKILLAAGIGAVAYVATLALLGERRTAPLTR